MKFFSTLPRVAAVAVVALGASGNASAELYRYDGVVTLCTPTCDSFDSLAAGTLVTGILEVNTTPSSAWTFADVAQEFSYEVFNPALPVVTAIVKPDPDPLCDDVDILDGQLCNPTSANPLPLNSTIAPIQETGVNPLETLTTQGTVDANSLFDSGTILHQFIIPPFNANQAWVVFDMATHNAQVCVFFSLLPCVELQGETAIIEGTFELILPELVADMSSLDFGTVQVGSTSATMTVTISNATEEALDISSVALGGADTGDFSIDADGCTAASLLLDESCTIDVTFTPTVDVARSAMLTILSNDPDPAMATLDIPLSGTGTAVPLPDIEVLPLAVVFPQLVIGDSATMMITINNNGNADLLIGTVGDPDPLAAPFSISADGCSMQLIASSGSCMLSVEFTPTAEGFIDDAFTIPSDDPDGTVVVSVEGIGLPVPVPDIDIATTAIDFGAVQIGLDASMDVTIDNVGTATLNIAAVSLAGTSATEFSVVDDCTAVDAGLSCTATVTFAPTIEGDAFATLTVSSDDADEGNVDIALSGMAFFPPAPVATATPDPLVIGTVAIGSTGSADLTVANEGDLDLNVTAVSGSGADAGYFALEHDCDVLAPDSSCTVTVSYSPTVGNSAVDFTVQIDSDDPAPERASLEVAVVAAAAGDTDGVDDATEDGAPNSGDGNSDGVADSDQPNVTSLPGMAGSYITVAVDSSMVLADVSVMANPDAAGTPDTVVFHSGGFASFTVEGAQINTPVTVQLTYHGAETFDTFYKFGPEPENNVNHLFEFTGGGDTGATVSGNTVTLTLIDGLTGDYPLFTIDGRIVDPGSPGTKVVPPAPPPATPVDPFPSGSINRALGDDGGNCFIATAAYGSYLDTHVVVLRQFRDEVLNSNAPGRWLVQSYYSLSPPVAEFIRGSETFRQLTRWALTPVVYALAYPLSALLLMLLALGGINLRRRLAAWPTASDQPAIS